MKKLHLWGILALLAFGLASCTDDNEVDDPNRYFVICPYTFNFHFDEYGNCEASGITPLTAEEFARSVVGAGWKHIVTHRLYSDGTTDSENFYEEMVGMNPTSYYYKDDHTCILYFLVDAVPAACYAVRDYQYEEDSNWIFVGEQKEAQIIELEGDDMWVLQTLGVTSDDEKIYGLSYYCRMTDQELKTYQETYNIDYGQAWWN
ncbi:MAG: hypothetical protein Q4D56_04080 [Bacteroides sp.]|nr:hypothetical protein [Bacteroides sp.]